MADIATPDRSVRAQANHISARMPVAGSESPGKVEGADQSDRAVKRARWPALEPCTDEEIATIARLRGLSIEGVTLASERGLLWAATSREGRAWVLTDSRRVNAQARRLDGLPWERIGAKAWTLPGSEAAWPLGLPEAAAHPAIALVEGGPDLLAAFHLAVQCGVSDIVAPVAMLGAGQSIPSDALPCFAGKGVRIFAHADESGQQAARRWAGQVKRTVRRFDAFTPSEGDLNDFVRRAGEDHASAMAFTEGLPPRRESPEDAESRRIAGELLRMQRAGAIKGPDDPEAPICAAVIRLFGARFGGFGKTPSAQAA